MPALVICDHCNETSTETRGFLSEDSVVLCTKCSYRGRDALLAPHRGRHAANTAITRMAFELVDDCYPELRNEPKGTSLKAVLAALKNPPPVPEVTRLRLEWKPGPSLTLEPVFIARLHAARLSTLQLADRATWTVKFGDWETSGEVKGADALADAQAAAEAALCACLHLMLTAFPPTATHPISYWDATRPDGSVVPLVVFGQPLSLADEEFLLAVDPRGLVQLYQLTRQGQYFRLDFHNHSVPGPIVTLKRSKQ